MSKKNQILLTFIPDAEGMPEITIICTTDRQQAALWAKADLILAALTAHGGQAA